VLGFAALTQIAIAEGAPHAITMLDEAALQFDGQTVNTAAITLLSTDPRAPLLAVDPAVVIAEGGTPSDKRALWGGVGQ